MLINVENLSITLKKNYPKKIFPDFLENFESRFYGIWATFHKKVGDPPLEHPFFGHILTLDFRLGDHFKGGWAFPKYITEQQRC